MFTLGQKCDSCFGENNTWEPVFVLEFNQEFAIRSYRINIAFSADTSNLFENARKTRTEAHAVQL